jgi:hypothetical protein
MNSLAELVEEVRKQLTKLSAQVARIELGVFVSIHWLRNTT